MLKLKQWVAGAVALVGTGSAFAQTTTDYSAIAVGSMAQLGTQFTGIFTAAVPYMLAVVGGMIAWKYAKKLGSKI